MTILALAGALAGGGLAAGCGDDDEGSSRPAESQEAKATPQQAVGEIGQVKAMLRQALVRYQKGDRKGADQLVGDAYLEHFELVEGPLEERDHELTERLEEQIREELREKIRRGASLAQVRALVGQIQTGLDQAAAKLA